MSFLKKILSLIIVSVTICSTFSFFQITSNAATYVTLSQFDTALNNFKSNKYKHDSTYVDNSSYGGYQCFGFANEIAKYIFGSFPCSNMSGNNINENWTRTYGSSAVDNLHVGDIVRYRFHSIFITKIVGNTIYYCDANADGKNTVKYNKSTSKSSLKSLVGEKLTHDNATTTGWVAHYKYWKDANTLTINYSPNGATIPASNSYKVSCDGSTLSLRSTASTSGTFLISIPDNTVLTVTETKSANGYIWGRTTYGGKTGWCALDYTVRQGYYVNSNKVYRYSDSSLAKTSWEYGKGDTTYGLFNYTSFNLQKDGYNFVGWSLSTDGSTGIFGQDDTTLKAETICPDVANSDKTVVLYAIWKPITYAVSYNANGGAGVPSAQTKIYGTALTLSSTKPTRTGYTFTGWNTNADGTGTKYAAGASYTSNAAITLYAQWTKVVLDSISIKTKPNKINYFVGETLNTSGLSLTASYSDGKTNTISSGFTCTPTTFNAAGTQKITVSYGEKSTSFNVTVENVVLSSVVVKSNPNKTTYNVGDTLNTTGLTLTATYNNGTTKTINSGFTCTPTTLITAGSQKITVTYGGKITTITVIVNEVKPETYTVKWIVDGAETTQTYVEGATIVKPAEPVKAGYTFVGWTPDVPSTMSAEDLTFTAEFEEIKYTCPDCDDEFTDEDEYNEHLAEEAAKKEYADAVNKAQVTIRKPSTDKISYGDSIVLHADLTVLPAGWKIVWESDNGNFSNSVSSDGKSCTITPSKSGNTTFTVKVLDAEGKEVSSDTQTMTSKAGFFDKIIAFFKKLFGSAKIIPQVFSVIK